MVRALVTGGAGFIGSHFIRVLLSAGDNKVVNLDKLTYAGNLENLRNIENSRDYTFVKGDICDQETVNEYSEDVELICNFAAESHVDRSIQDASLFVETNIKGTHNLLEVARQRDLMMVQISTDEVYGSIKQGAFQEHSPLNPSNPYAASKASADLLVLSYHRTYGLDVIITRSSNNYGPFQYPEKLIPKLITNLLQNRKLPIYGNGQNIRDWLYVIDNCKAIELVYKKGRKGEIYNIGSDNSVTNLQLARTILRKLGMQENMIEFVQDRLGHDRRYAIDWEKIRKLGWEPQTRLDIGLSTTVKWYQENQAWWKPLVIR